MCDDDDNAYKIGSLLVQMHGDPVATETKSALTTQQNKLDLSVDEIEPLILTEAKEKSSEMASISQSIKENDTESYYIKSPCEETYDPQPSPRYLDFTPYASVYHEPSAINYNYSSASFHSAMSYGYPQSLETSPQQVYTKNIYPSELMHSFGERNMNPSGSYSNPGASEMKYFYPSFYGKDRDLVNSNKGLIREDSGFDETIKTTEEIMNDTLDNPLEIHDSDKINDEIIDITDQYRSKISSEISTKNTTQDYPDFENAAGDNVGVNSFKSEVEEKYDVTKFSSTNFSSTQLSCTQNSNVALQNFDADAEEEEIDSYLQKTPQFQDRIYPGMFIPCQGAFQINSLDRGHPQFGDNMLNSRLMYKSYELYNCSECDYSSYNKSNFKNHLFIHSEKRRFACPYCTYRGKQSAGLRAHMKVHSVEKPFLCSICNYRCKRKQNLVQHMRIHCKYRPFLCSYCNYETTNKKSLQNHMTEHFKEDFNTHDKKFKVENPDAKNFELRNNLQDDKERQGSYSSSHTNAASSDITLKCSYCDFSTTRKCAFQNHIKTHKDSELKNLFSERNCEPDQTREAHVANQINGVGCKPCQHESDSASDFAKPRAQHDSKPKDLQARSNLLDEISKCSINVRYKNHPLQCPYCPYESDSVKCLRLHIDNHSDEDLIAFVRHPQAETRFKSNEKMSWTKNAKNKRLQFRNNDEEKTEIPAKVQDAESSHSLTGYCNMAEENETEDEMNHSSLKDFERHTNVLQKRRNNSLHYLKWNFSRNKRSQHLKNDKLSKKASTKTEQNFKIKDELKSDAQTSNDFKEKLEFDATIEDKTSKRNAVKETEEDEDNLVSLKAKSVRPESKKGDGILDNESSRDPFEDENFAETNVKNIDVKSDFIDHSNDDYKTADDQHNEASVNDNHEFCGFSNETIEKCSEFTSSFLAKFDPLKIRTPQLSNSTPRADLESFSDKFVDEVDSPESGSTNNYFPNILNQSTREDLEQECDNSKGIPKTISRHASQRIDTNENEMSNILQSLLKTKKGDEIADEKYPEGKEKGLKHFKFVNIETEIMKAKSFCNPINRLQETKESNTINPNVENSTSNAESELFPCSLPKELPEGRTNSIKEDEMFRCTTCNSSFVRKSSLANHIRSHTRDSFKCSKCPITFRYRRAMQDHEKIHVKEKTFDCSQCDFSSKRKCSLMSHYRCHRKKFKCIHCNFECSIIKKMETHYEQHKADQNGQPCLSRSRRSAGKHD